MEAREHTQMVGVFNTLNTDYKGYKKLQDGTRLIQSTAFGTLPASKTMNKAELSEYSWNSGSKGTLGEG